MKSELGNILPTKLKVQEIKNRFNFVTDKPMETGNETLQTSELFSIFHLTVLYSGGKRWHKSIAVLQLRTSRYIRMKYDKGITE